MVCHIHGPGIDGKGNHCSQLYDGRQMGEVARMPKFSATHLVLVRGQRTLGRAEEAGPWPKNGGCKSMQLTLYSLVAPLPGLCCPIIMANPFGSDNSTKV